MSFQFKPLGNTCAATGERLAPGTVCHSVVLRDGESWIRQDFSPEGWTGPPEGTIGHWQTAVPVPESKSRRLDPDELLEFLERLDEEADPERDSLKYVVALLLVRSKRLELDESRWEDDEEIQVFNGTRGEGRFEVRTPDLDENGIAELQRELQAKLEAGCLED